MITTSFFGVDALEPGDFVCRVTDASGVVVVQKALAAVVGVYGVPYGMATQASSAGGAAVIALDGLHAEEIHELTGGPSKLRLNTTTGRAEKVGSYGAGDIPVGNLNGQNFLALLPSAAAAAAVVSGIASVAGSGQITVTGAGDKTIASASLDQLHANNLQSASPLLDENATLLVGNGRRYVVPAATLSATRRTITLDVAGAVAEDVITIDRRDTSGWPLQVVSAGTMLTMVNRRGLYRFRYDGSAWLFDDHSARMRVFNVVDFGARGDENYSSVSTTTERNAIQAAIDAAAAYCRDIYGAGAVVEFGSGVYRVDGSLIMRRTPRERPIIYRGDGALISGQGVLNYDLFRVESLAENPTITHGGYGHVFEGLYFVGGARNLSWDLGWPGAYGYLDGVRSQLHFYRCVFDHDGTGPAVRLQSPTRTRFFDCDVDPAFSTQGNCWVEIINGSASFYGCQGGGSFLRARNGGEIYMYGCRPEGGMLTPAIDLYDIDGFILHGGSTEGHDEGPAILRLEACKRVNIDSFVLASTDRSYIRARGRRTFADVPVVFEVKDNAPYIPSTFPVCRRTDGGSWFVDGVAYGSKVRFTAGSTLNASPTVFTVKEMTHELLYFEEAITPETATVSGEASAYMSTRLYAPQITFATGGSNTITRNVGNWIDDGFVAGMKIYKTNATNVANRGLTGGGGGTQDLTITDVTATVLTVTEVLANETVELGDVFADAFGDGILLKDVDNFYIRAHAPGVFVNAGAQTCHGVSVDADCRDGIVYLSGPGVISAGQIDIDISPSAHNVVAEYAGNDGALNPVTTFLGAHRFAEVDVEENVVHTRVGKTGAPSTLAGLSVKLATGNGYTGIWFDATAGQTGWKTAASADELALGALSDFYASRYVGPTGDNLKLATNVGRAYEIRFSVASIGDTDGLAILRNGTTNTQFISVQSLLFTTSAGSIRFAPAGALGFFGAAGVTQAADTVALTDSSGGTADGTVAAVSGSGADATINDNFADLAAKYNALRTLLRNYGLMA